MVLNYKLKIKEINLQKILIINKKWIKLKKIYLLSKSNKKELIKNIKKLKIIFNNLIVKPFKLIENYKNLYNKPNKKISKLIHH